eukprot:TRINITY_DN36308_c1_g1_i1.p2 TRINITY_DN36308_c1_g1~~TRINITY_DN36308_c1_g1_i1.p2  ORF type:complete len:148 (+),score=46.09 TRINITY_DN36308_c1_g1_i1:135-578(+)
MALYQAPAKDSGFVFSAALQQPAAVAAAEAQAEAAAAKAKPGTDEVTVKVTRRGNGELPALGHTVVVKLDNGRLADGGPIPMPQLVQFEIGGEEVVPGLEEAVKGMSLNERCSVSISPGEAYGSGGLLGAVPAGATLLMDLELLGFV